MSMFSLQIVPMADRKYRLVPVDKIRVLNSRDREQQQFQENVKSIDSIGLLKPIVVNSRPLEKEGYYELVCGEGRFLAFKALGKAKIPAEVIDCDCRKALLFSLVENIARVPPDTMWFARELKRMKDSGMPTGRICEIAGKTETYVVDYIRLVEMGEERLIRGVEQGLFSMSFATIIAKSSTSEIQNVLMDAFDSGFVNSANAAKVRNLIEMRLRGSKKTDRRASAQPGYSVKQLKTDIARLTQEKEGFVHETSAKETRLLTLIGGLDEAWQDDGFVAVLKVEGLAERPQLVGKYSA